VVYFLWLDISDIFYLEFKQEYFMKKLFMSIVLTSLIGLSSNIFAQKSNNQSTVNLNSGEVQSLVKLPLINKSKAKKIISFREDNGCFKTLEALKGVKGIGKGTMRRINKAIEQGTLVVNLDAEHCSS